MSQRRCCRCCHRRRRRRIAQIPFSNQILFKLNVHHIVRIEILFTFKIIRLLNSDDFTFSKVYFDYKSINFPFNAKAIGFENVEKKPHDHRKWIKLQSIHNILSTMDLFQFIK